MFNFKIYLAKTISFIKSIVLSVSNIYESNKTCLTHFNIEITKSSYISHIHECNKTCLTCKGWNVIKGWSIIGTLEETEKSLKKTRKDESS